MKYSVKHRRARVAIQIISDVRLRHARPIAIVTEVPLRRERPRTGAVAAGKLGHNGESVLGIIGLHEP